MPRPLFYVSHVLAWCDAYHKRMGRWPNLNCGRVPGGIDETWRRVDSALRLGLRGLPGGSSLARLLADKRGVRNLGDLPRLTVKQILAWADAHHRRQNAWPTSESGPLSDAPGETWKAIDHALRLGMRSLPGDSSLSRLLEKHRHVPNIQNLPRLTSKQLLAWADAHFERAGDWPNSHTGPIRGVVRETWSSVNAALQKGRRGFPGGSSLARLLAKERGVRNPKDPRPLSEALIIRWADAYHRRNGAWPSRYSGSIPEVHGETWAMVDRALCYAQRGLRRKSSLFRLLRKHRGIPIHYHKLGK